MKTLFTITVKVTRPYPKDEDNNIKSDFAEVLAETIKRVVQDELQNIVGLGVEVTIR